MSTKPSQISGFIGLFYLILVLPKEVILTGWRTITSLDVVLLFQLVNPRVFLTLQFGFSAWGEDHFISTALTAGVDILEIQRPLAV